LDRQRTSYALWGLHKWWRSVIKSESNIARRVMVGYQSIGSVVGYGTSGNIGLFLRVDLHFHDHSVEHARTGGCRRLNTSNSPL